MFDKFWNGQGCLGRVFSRFNQQECFKSNEVVRFIYRVLWESRYAWAAWTTWRRGILSRDRWSSFGNIKIRRFRGQACHLRVWHLACCFQKVNLAWKNRFSKGGRDLVRRLFCSRLKCWTKNVWKPGGAIRKQVQPSKNSKLFPRLEVTDKRGTIARRRFPLHNAIPQEIDISEMKSVCS